MILIQHTFCQIQRISPCGPLVFRSVCALKKQSGVNTKPCFCKRETKRGSGRATNPGIKYQCFSCLSTKHFGIVFHKSCSYTGQNHGVSHSREFEGVLKGRMYFLTVEFIYQQPFSRIIDYTF